MLKKKKQEEEEEEVGWFCAQIDLGDPTTIRSCLVEADTTPSLPFFFSFLFFQRHTLSLSVYVYFLILLKKKKIIKKTVFN